MKAIHRKPGFLLGIGVLAASSSAVLIRFASDAEPLAIAFWRCAAGALILAPAAFMAGEMSFRRLALPGIAGAFLAFHFATWISSLDYTTVAASVLLVSTTPVLVGLVSHIGGHRLGGLGWWGIALALGGTALIAGDPSGARTLGSVLALGGAIGGAGYFLAGERARRELGIATYAAVTYAVAALLIGAVVLGSDIPLSGYDRTTWLALVGLIVGPQLLGHTLINFALAGIDATTVTVAIMAEPVIAIALAFFFLAEAPTTAVFPGGAAILLGIYLVSRVRRAMPAVVTD
ncbi:MAG TPA: DMT family transporter [Actinomycetota bacterium]|nr:DMT family transporter [Actinomycetota bacterium]